MKSRLNVIVARLAVLLVALGVAFVAVEILLRVFGFAPSFASPLNGFHRADPEVGWVGVPDLDARFRNERFDTRVRTNAEGFRGVESEVEVRADAPEIWLLGDSTGWGYGVSNGELFADRLQGLIGADWRVVNLAMNAYGTLQERLLLDRLLAEREAPDHLLLLVCNNDFRDNLKGNENSRPFLERNGNAFEVRNLPVENPIGGLGAELAKRSRAFSLLASASYLLKHGGDSGGGTEAGEEKGGAGDAPRPVEGDPKKRLPEIQVAAMRHALLGLRDSCRAKDIELTVILYPKINARTTRTAEGVALAEICDTVGIDLVDLQPIVAEEPDRYFIGQGDFHWNAEGNRAGAEEVHRRIAGKLER